MTVPVGRRLAWMSLLQAAWLALAVLSLVLFVRGLPLAFARAQQTCSGSLCAYHQLAPTAAGALAASGVSLRAYAVASITLQVAAALLALVVALLIVWRRRADPSAMAMALLLLTLPQSNVVQAQQGLDPALTLPLQVLGWVTASCLPAVFYTFPDGRFVPGWTRWLAAGWVGLMALDNFWRGFLERYLTGQVLGVVFVSFFISFALALGVRYRRAGDFQRQQIKWVVFAGGLGLVVFAGYTVAVNLSGVALLPVGRPVIDFLFNGLLALSVGVAILRHRLWDIDLLINRALVYAVLTVLLSAVYLGSVVALQGALRLISGEDTPLAIVASTLLLAALFRPLRARVQAGIDRRFYRRKYNAGQVLTRFGALLREHTYADPEQASDALLGVVAETLQPSHVSLWLQPAPAGPHRSRTT